MEIKFVHGKINIEENELKDKNLILFIYDLFGKDFIIKFKSIYNQIIKLNNEKIIIGIISYNNNSENKEIIDLSKSLDIFYEKLDDKIELYDFLRDIKNKYLNHLENKILESEEGTYYGDFENDKKEGCGIMLYESGVIYAGEWKNNYINGNGILINSHDNIKMIGNFKYEELMSGKKYFSNNLLEGGIYKFRESLFEKYTKFLDLLNYKGSMDEGDWYGKLELKNGNIYEGKFNNFCDGEGTITYPNGVIYKGKWKNFKKNGKGTIHLENGTKYELEWKDDKLINNNIQISDDNGIIFIGKICEEEKNDDEIFDFHFEKNIENYTFEEKLKIFEDYFSGGNNFQYLEEYDEDIERIEYNIKDIYHFWKIGKDKWEKKDNYIYRAKKYLFFKEFYNNLFNSDKSFKRNMINQIDSLFKEYLYIKKYLIFKFGIKLICNEPNNIEIIEKNYLKFKEIDFFNGIIDNKGIDLNKQLNIIKGIMKYENGDVYLGNFKNGKKDGKGIMIYTNGEIFEGYWKNDNKKELVSKYSNSQIIKYYEQFKSEKFDHNNLDNAKLNNNDLDDFIKKIDLNTQYCQLHKNLIIGLCIDKDCKEKNKLICQKCIFREHKKHDITEIQEHNDKFRENVIKGEKLILEMNDINENKKFSDKKLELKISELKLYVNE